MRLTRIISVTILIIFSQAFYPSVTAFSQNSVAKIGILEQITAQPNTRIKAPIMAQDVSNLYAVDLELFFDADVLQAEDADPNQTGVQIGLGNFLGPGLLLQNEVDNQRGVIRFVMSQVHPSQEKSGSGILFVIYFKGIREGQSPLEFSFLQTANSRGEEIETLAINSNLTITSSSQVLSATSIPISNPSAMILIPTLAATATFGASQQPQLQIEERNPSDMIGAFQSPVSQPATYQTLSGFSSPEQSNETNSQPSELQHGRQPSSFRLAENWWIVASMVVIFFGLALITRHKRHKSKDTFQSNN